MSIKIDLVFAVLMFKLGLLTTKALEKLMKKLFSTFVKTSRKVIKTSFLNKEFSFYAKFHVLIKFGWSFSQSRVTLLRHEYFKLTSTLLFYFICQMYFFNFPSFWKYTFKALTLLYVVDYGEDFSIPTFQRALNGF